MRIEPTVHHPYAPRSNLPPAEKYAKNYDNAPGLARSTTGVLFTSFDDGTNGRCSATVVNSESKNVIVTAAHCLHDVKSPRKPTGSLFVPAYKPGDEPYGRWAAVSFSLPSQFAPTARENERGIIGDGWRYDFAFLSVESKDGTHIQDVTGGMGIAFGVPVENYINIGYPSEKPWTGDERLYCSHDSWQAGYLGSFMSQCTMTSGSSGGPARAGFDKDTGWGYVIGVNRTMLRHEPFWNEATSLGEVAKQLYEQEGGWKS